MSVSTLQELIGSKFIKKKSYLGYKEKETLYIVEDCNIDQFQSSKYVLLFFSAGWCAPCEQFLQVLKDFYSEVNLTERNVEILYVSSDGDEQAFKESYAKMPWLTVPFSNQLHENLKQKFEITGVPLVTVCEAATGFVITHKGRKDIFDLGINCLTNWNNDMPANKIKTEQLDKGLYTVEYQRRKAEEEIMKKLQAEKDE